MQKYPKCKTCGKEHALGGCPEFQSKAARKDVHRVLPVKATVDPKQESGNQAPPVDASPKPKMGRPRTGYIKAEYNRQYMADLRTIKRLGLSVTVAQYRKSKEK